MSQPKILSAQVSEQFFKSVKIALVQRGLNMKDAIIIGLSQLLGLDPEQELSRGGDSNGFNGNNK